ncbi:MAG: thioredoxin-disulfide reductase [Schleiferiaceae bacterium]|jgi:thioredoxin reductase (NADPH)|nr:thioredoxin-disulfide reductase [Flavobacteriales bacterium]MDO7566488.1 thioredoxin-disulfide reductase [Schleiferiaceae bacterium]MBT5421787.1 thioredoxin-disulfide reductase [Flavobacteriales bacterium]MDO7661011.1 thioredoxin-disulfide reductase [Schleiferiaceae bacterium]MDO7687715.1 thioredoxin-disulfide reductase [Schleiferiaceae bacterium]
MEQHDCLIIGSGPAGYTAAIYASRADLNPIMYVGLQPGGQLTTTTEVDNFPGYPEGTDGNAMMDDLKKQAERFGTDVRWGMVTEVDFANKAGDYHTLTIDGETKIQAKTVIISTGATAKYLGLPSEEKFMGFGVSACAVCDGFFYKGQEVVVVGAGDTAAEEATYLAKICPKVTLLVRRDQMRASKAMQNRVLNTNNIEIKWNTETVEIQGGQSVETVVVKNTLTGEIENIAASGFFVAIGHKPNTDIFKGILDMDETGYLTPTLGKTATNKPGVFAAGDVADKVYRQAVTAAGTGCMAALESERYLSEFH